MQCCRSTPVIGGGLVGVAEFEEMECQAYRVTLDVPALRWVVTSSSCLKGGWQAAGHHASHRRPQVLLQAGAHRQWSQGVGPDVQLCLHSHAPTGASRRFPAISASWLGNAAAWGPLRRSQPHRPLYPAGECPWPSFPVAGSASPISMEAVPEFLATIA